MAKIDDLAELLVEELSDFKTQLYKMEQLSKELKTIPLSPDLREMKSVWSISLKQQEELSVKQHKKISELITKLSMSNHYPNWIIILFATLLLCCFLLTSFAIYNLNSISETNLEYYEKGQDEVISHFNSFLKDNQETNEAYQKWSNAKTE